MQWLIDIIVAIVLGHFEGMIVMWSGAIVDIPSGWALCDGANDTPDLRNRFILAAGATYDPDDTGGSTIHSHLFGIGHNHNLLGGTDVEHGTGWQGKTDFTDKGRTTEWSNTFPSYYALAYIMKL